MWYLSALGYGPSTASYLAVPGRSHFLVRALRGRAHGAPDAVPSSTYRTCWIDPGSKKTPTGQVSSVRSAHSGTGRGGDRGLGPEDRSDTQLVVGLPTGC